MKSILIAGSRAHAHAIMRWCRYGAEGWDVAVYGDAITDRYATAVLARPVGEITDDHAAWVTHVLRPLVVGSMTPLAGWAAEVRAPAPIEDELDADRLPAARMG